MIVSVVSSFLATNEIGLPQRLAPTFEIRNAKFVRIVEDKSFLEGQEGTINVDSIVARDRRHPAQIQWSRSHGPVLVVECVAGVVLLLMPENFYCTASSGIVRH